MNKIFSILKTCFLIVKGIFYDLSEREFEYMAKNVFKLKNVDILFRIKEK
jgi:hypothetical protein